MVIISGVPIFRIFTVCTQAISKLHIRRTADNSEIIFIFSVKYNVLNPLQNRLRERVLMRGHFICFYGIIWRISSELYPYLFLS